MVLWLFWLRRWPEMDEHSRVLEIMSLVYGEDFLVEEARSVK